MPVTEEHAGRGAQGKLVRTVLVGLAAGFLSGLFGVGGGILIVPGLVYVLAMSQRLAHGTSLAAVLPIAASGVTGYAFEGSIDWPVAVALAAGAMAGAVIGTNALQRLSPSALARVFAVVLVLSAARLVFDDSHGSGRAELTLAAVGGLILVGLLSGVLAGLLGVGGGVVMVPAMVILFGMSAALAKGTSLAVIVPTSIVATRRNLRNRNADLRAAVAVGLSGMVSAYLASKISVGLDEGASNAMFAALLTFVAVRMVVRSFRSRE